MERGFVYSADILRTRRDGGSSYVDVRTFWCKKLRIFSKYMVYPHGQGEMGSIFCDFVRTSFMDGPLLKNEVKNLK